MAYEVTVLSVSAPIPTGGNASAPWGYWVGQTIEFTDPTLHRIEIQDDDPNFDSQYYHHDDQQIVAEDVTIGNLYIPAGTRLSTYLASVITDEDGNQYFVMFPRQAEPGSFGAELGSKTELLILPYNGGQAPHEVPFDPVAKTYTMVRVLNSPADMSVPYGVPCFAGGTVIDTQLGPRRIEALQPGDMIRTRDNGMRWLCWIGSVELTGDQLQQRPNLRPIRIRAGALAPGIPAQDLTVSPQHRMLIRSSLCARLFGEVEMLVAAKHLLELPGIEVVQPDTGIRYWHMLFDGHEVVHSNGAWSESLFTGPQALKSISPAARREILELFPELAAPGFTPRGARRFATGREGRKLARHAGRALIRQD